MRRLVLIATLLAAGPAYAIDFTTPLLDSDDKPLTECVAHCDEPPPKQELRAVTLGLIAMRALAAPEQNLPAEEALKRGNLALQVYKAKDARLTAEDVALIKRTIARSFSPLIVARSFPLLDPAAK